MKQKGIVSYGIANNRQNPLAGTFHDAIFNTWRRFSGQVLYVAPPMIFGYYVLNWAIERYVAMGVYVLGGMGCRNTAPNMVYRNEYLNSKAGRAEFADSE